MNVIDAAEWVNTVQVATWLIYWNANNKHVVLNFNGQILCTHVENTVSKLASFEARKAYMADRNGRCGGCGAFGWTFFSEASGIHPVNIMAWQEKYNGILGHLKEAANNFHSAKWQREITIKTSLLQQTYCGTYNGIK